tara:strand:+ start:683 stop:1288 length:606 start_codon:yes stop_codon:yes gene_type:complete
MKTFTTISYEDTQEDLSPDSWAVDNPEDYKWLTDNASQNDFAASLLSFLNTHGHLTEKQHQCVKRNVCKDQPLDVNSLELEEKFKTARSNGVKWPRMTFDNIKVKLAGDNSRNPGALYVTEYGNYLGKVYHGKFYKVPECSPEASEKIKKLISDPEMTVKRYGIETGQCCICSRTLTNPESIKLGMGPICRTSFGFSGTFI